MSGEISDRDLELADLANAAGASDFTPGATAPQMARQQRLAYEQARQALEAIRPAVKTTIVYHDGIERRAAAAQPRFYQPFAGAVIIDTTTGEPYWSEPGGFYIEGVYFGARGAADRARFNAIERLHRAALREDAWRARDVAERAERWELTDAGRAALAAETRRAS